MKTLVGRILMLVVLSCGAGLVAASPSSALPDDPCMDAANYLTQSGWYQAHVDGSYDALLAWENADHHTNPLNGQETWTAYLPTGAVSVYTLGDLTLRQDSAQYNYEHNLLAQMDWEGSHYPCP